MFEAGMFPGAGDQEHLDRLKAKYKAGDIINFRSGNKAEVLAVLPEGLRVVGPGPHSDSEVGVIPWNALGAIARLGMVEAKLFPGADRDEMNRRKPPAKTYQEWAENEGLRPRKAKVFAGYMKARWGMRHLNTGYGRDWMERFEYNYAYGASDPSGQAILKKLGVRKGVDSYNGDVVDHYFDINEAYRIKREIKKSINMSPNDLPYTYEDITQLPEYKAIMDIPGTFDATTSLQKSRRGVVIMITPPVPRVANEARMFPGADDKEMRKRKKEWRDTQPKRDQEEIIYDLRRSLRYALEQKVYATYANGYVRYVTTNTYRSGGPHTTTGVLTQLDPALDIDGYRKLLVRLKQTIMRKVNSVDRIQKKLTKLLLGDAVEPVAEASRLFPGADDAEIDSRRTEHQKELIARKKKQMEDPNTWQAVAKKELEHELEVETEIENSIDFDNDEFLLTAMFDSEGNNEESQWLVYKDDSIAIYEAEQQVEDMINDSPESFTQDWLAEFMYISEGDRSGMAQEESDHLVDDMEEAELLLEANDDEEDEHEALQDKIDELYDQDPVQEGFKEKLHALTDAQERIIDTLREEYRDKKYDEIFEELRDPVDYFVDTHGMYTLEELVKAPFMSIETDMAATDAVATNGAAHFLDSYDGKGVELSSGAIAMGR